MKADRIIKDTIALDPASGRVTGALAMSGGRLIATGSPEALDGLRGPHTVVDSLPGLTVLPGFCDSHLHMVGIGLALLGVDLQVEAGITTIDALVAAVRDRAAKIPAGQWVLGRGFDDLRLQERRNPLAADLDRASDAHPVLIRRSCGHLAVLNTRALELAGITADTPDPPGGKIERDETGRPTGVLRESAAGLVQRDQLYGPRDYRQAAELAATTLVAHGITSAHSMDSDWLHVTSQLATMAGCPRLYLTTQASSLADLEASAVFNLGFASGFGTDRLRLGPVKVMLDGSDDSGSALMHQAYEGRPDLGTGMTVMDPLEAAEVVTRAHRRGLQTSIHAIGDRAVDLAADIIGEAMAAAPRPDPRHRIEHCSFLTPHSQAAIKRLGIVAPVQPPFIPMMDGAYRQLLGRDRMSRGYMFATLLRLARAVPAGSDAPVADMCPLKGIRAAVTRLQGDGVISAPAEHVSLLDALRMYTLHGAVAAFDEGRTGSLAPGAAADLVVLSSAIDPAAMSLEPDTRVVATMIAGSWVYPDPTGPSGT